jgi:hypothetical protein
MASVFLKLPAELRINIYNKIIHSIPAADPPTNTSTPSEAIFKQYFVDKRVAASHDLDSYHGLLLSCKKIYHEFENEWLKAFGPWLHEHFSFTRLILPTITKISDSVHIRIGFHDQIQGWLHDATDYSCGYAARRQPSVLLHLSEHD